MRGMCNRGEGFEGQARGYNWGKERFENVYTILPTLATTIVNPARSQGDI